MVFFLPSHGKTQLCPLLGWVLTRFVLLKHVLVGVVKGGGPVCKEHGLKGSETEHMDSSGEFLHTGCQFV